MAARATRPPAPAAPRPRRRGRRLALLAVLGLLLALRRRRSRDRPAQEQARPAPTVPAVPGRTAPATPVPGPRAASGPAAPGSPRLAPVHGGTVPHGTPVMTALPLSVGRLVLGRDEAADLRLDHPSVSPRHALLEVAPDGAVHLTDLGALNGVQVDGVPVATAQLHDGNRLDLGEVQLVFHCDPPEDDGGRQGGELGEQPHHREQGRD